MAQINDRSLAIKSVLKESLREDRQKISEHLRKANEILGDATFKTFDSDTISTTHNKLGVKEFLSIVDTIVKSYGFTEAHKAQLKDLKGAGANKMKILKIHRASKDGVIYGIFSVSGRGDNIDMAYAVYTAKYEFEQSVKTTRERKKFFRATWDDTETKECEHPCIPTRTPPLMQAFFENRAIEALEQEW